MPKVEPQFAELALDKALSGSLPPLSVEAGAASPTLGIVTDFTTRNIIQGELGVPFFLPDPRDKNRIAVIAGMGLVGQFGAPELAILVEQLFWALARLGRRHLATVLIGSGTGNIETETAVGRWMDGAARAIVNGQHLPSLTDLTFVELAPAKAENIRSALLDYTTGLNRLGLSISVTPSEPIPVPEGTIPPTSSRNQITTHICGEQRGKKYLFGAMSDEASYHQDQNEFDPDTISRANDDLAAKETPDHQRQAGEYLFKLLVPKSQSEAFARKDPIVIQCDHEIAHLHWEMMVVPGLPRNSIGDGSEFLGIYPGIARQLRTNFDVPPEPPPTYERTLRILIVADTDESRPVPPSQNEAQTIEALFNTLRDRLGSSGSKQQVFVESLIGPDLASYDNVLERLLRYPAYDILHFSGHCEYDDDEPPKSGWLFSKGKQITAYELSRVERLPGFVFSNACYSGEIPERTGRRAIPSFAESFFQKGVKNFVCTAWPVVSEPAHDFACKFYKEFLGTAERRGGHMFEAMREARKSIWNACPSARRTWGAYQHYGNPWFRLP
jgi:CHAT domain